MKAKKIITIILILAALLYVAYLNSQQAATKADLREFRNEVELRFNLVDKNFDTVKANQDSLKIGQRIIFDEIQAGKSATQSSFTEKLKKFLNL